MPVKSVRELVDYVSARPDKLAYATTIGGSFFAGALFARAAGLKITAVAYNSGPQAIAAVLSGDINYLFYPYQALLPQISSNRLRALATTARTRPSWLPNVPTMIESGYPDVDLSTFVGLYAPLKTPRNVIEIFSRAMTDALRDPDLQKKYADAGTTVTLMSPAESDKFTSAQVKRLRELDKMSSAKSN